MVQQLFSTVQFNKIRSFSMGLISCILFCPWSIKGISDIPITLQSLVIFSLALICSPSVSILIVLSYLLLGGIGLPVFANFQSGWSHFMGASGFFLIAFPFVALFISILKRFFPKELLYFIILFLLGHFLLLLIGLGLPFLLQLKSQEQVLQTLILLIPGWIIKSSFGGVLVWLFQFLKNKNENAKMPKA